ncbi:MAG: Uma2 family endonuclease, partial [Pyrinomonadaceae bacterium]
GEDCFYIQHAVAVAGKDRLNLANDPPPDLEIEIDLASESTNKFAVYAALGVPEIWHYDGRYWQVLKLTGQTYEPTSFSLAFPFISDAHLTEFVEQSERESSFKARRTFRDWVRANKTVTS